MEKASLDTVYQKLEISAQGLTSTDAEARLEKYSRNELVTKEASDLEKFLRFFWGPIACMIQAAALKALYDIHMPIGSVQAIGEEDKSRAYEK